MKISWKISRKKENGQAMLEFALILPVLLLLLVGIIDFGLIFFKWLAVEHSARDAARYASLGGSAGNAKNLAASELQTAGIQNANVNVSLAPYTSPQSNGQTGNASNLGGGSGGGSDFNSNFGATSGNDSSGWSENQWLNQWLSFLQGVWSGNQQANWAGGLPEPWSGGSAGGSGSGGAPLQLNEVTVSIDYPVKLFDPIMSSILGNPFPIHSTVTMLVEPSTSAASGSSQGSTGNPGSGGQGNDNQGSDSQGNDNQGNNRDWNNN